MLHFHLRFTENSTARKMKFSINDFFSKCDQIRYWLRSGVFIANFEHISGYWGRSGVFIANFEHISDFFLVFLLRSLNK